MDFESIYIALGIILSYLLAGFIGALIGFSAEEKHFQYQVCEMYCNNITEYNNCVDGEFYLKNYIKKRLKERI